MSDLEDFLKEISEIKQAVESGQIPLDDEEGTSAQTSLEGDLDGDRKANNTSNHTESSSNKTIGSSSSNIVNSYSKAVPTLVPSQSKSSSNTSSSTSVKSIRSAPRALLTAKTAVITKAPAKSASVPSSVAIPSNPSSSLATSGLGSKGFSILTPPYAGAGSGFTMETISALLGNSSNASAVNTPLPSSSASHETASKRPADSSTKWNPETSEFPENDFRLYVANLGNDVTDEVLGNAFRKYNSFKGAKVIRDKISRKTKGFGYVSIMERDDALAALKEMNNAYVGSRTITVVIADKKKIANSMSNQHKKPRTA